MVIEVSSPLFEDPREQLPGGIQPEATPKEEIDAQLQSLTSQSVEAGATLEDVEALGGQLTVQDPEVISGIPQGQELNFQLPDEENPSFLIEDSIEETINPNEKGASKAAAYIAALGDSDDLVGSYSRNKEEILQTGTSQEGQQLANQFAAEEIEAQQQSVIDILLDTSIPLEDKQFLDMEFRLPERLRLDEEYSMRVAAKADDPKYSANMQAILDAQNQTRTILEEALIETGEKVGLGDFIGALAPARYQLFINDVISEAFSERSDLFQTLETFILPGDAVDTIAEWVLELPPAERVEKIKEIVDILKREGEDAIAGDLLALQTIEGISARILANENPEEFDVWGTLDNVTGTLDFIGAVKAGKTVLKGGMNLPKGSMASRSNASNPEEGAAINAAAISDPEIAKATGTTQENAAIANLLPKPEELIEQLEGAPQAVKTEIESMDKGLNALANRTIDRLDNIAPESTRTIDLSPEAKNVLRAKEEATYYDNMSTIQRSKTGFRVNAVFGKSDTAGFTSAKAAQATADDMFPGAKVELVEKDIATTQSKKVTVAEDVTKVSEAVKRELIPRVGNKLKLGERKDLERELGVINDQIKDLKTPKKVKVPGIDRPQLVRGRKETQEAIKQLEDNKAIIQQKLKRDNEAETAESNLSRLEQGQFDKLDGEVKALFKSLATRVDEIPEEVTSKEYFFRVQYDHITDPVDKVMFGAEDILTNNAVSDWLLDPASKFARWITGKAEFAIDQSKLLQKELFDGLKPFLSLNNRGKHRVVKVLQEGESVKTFTYRELQAKGLSDAEVLGYYSYRRSSDAMLTLKNIDARKSLQQDGFKWAIINDLNYAVKPISKENVNVRAFYDPVNRTEVTLSGKSLDEFYQQGGRVVQLKQSERIGNSKYNFAVIKADQSITELPPTVINQIPGYVARFYDERYFMTRTSAGAVDGLRSKEAIKEVIQVVGGRKEAERLEKELNAAAEEGISYEWKHDRALTAAQRREQQDANDIQSGLFSFARRGDHVKATEGLAEIENPVESMRRSMDALSNRLLLEPVTQDLRERWVNTFGDFTKGQFPANEADIVNTNKLFDKRAAKARAMWDYINTLEGTPTKFDMQWKQLMLWLGEHLEGQNKASMFIANTLKEVGEQFNPLRSLRGLAFNLFIIGNPVRQLLIQSAQAHYLAGVNPIYVLNPNGMARHNLGLQFGMLAGTDSIDNINNWWELSAKMLGTDVPGAKKTINAFKESGLPYSIDSHLLARDGAIEFSKEMSTNRVGAFARESLNLAKLPLKVARTVGFDAGEYNNLSMSWLVARDRLLKKKPDADLSNLKVIEELAIDTRGLSLSMNRAGALKYQQGWFSAATQFLSFQHKALLSVLPGRFGNQAFTAKEKTGLFVSQLLFWGSSGLGAKAIYDEAKEHFGLDPEPWIDNLIEGGIAESLINSGIQQITEDSTELSIAENFAPLSGAFNSGVDKLLAAIFTGELSAMELLIGPSAKGLGKVGDALATGNFFFGKSDLSDPEELATTINQYGSMFSGASALIKYMGYRNIQSAVNKHGDPLFQQTNAEALSTVLLGIPSKAQEEHYNRLTDRRQWQKEVKDEAKRIVSMMKRFSNTQLIPASNPLDGKLNAYHDRLRIATEFAPSHIWSTYDPDMAEAIQLEVQRLLTKNVEDGDTELIENIINGFVSGREGIGVEGVINQIKDSQWEKQNPEKAQLYIKLLEDAMATSKFTQEMKKEAFK